MTDSKDRFDLDALRALVAAAPGCPEFPALAEAERRAGDAEAARRIAEAGLAAAPGRLAGRVALGLALVDLGRLQHARGELAVILDAVLEPHRLASAAPAAVPAPVPAEVPAVTADAVGDDELEQAFAAAAPEVEAMLSPNHMAERVLRDHVPLDGEEEPFDEAAFEPLDPARYTDDPAGDDEAFFSAAEPIDETADDLAAEDEIAAASSPRFRTATMADLLARQGDVEAADAIRRELAGRSAAIFGEGGTAAAAAVSAALPVAGPDAAFVPEAGPVPGASGTAGSPAEAARQTRILATLERWLHNIQRGPA